MTAGQNTSAEVEHAPGTYFVADDGYGELYLWIATPGEPRALTCQSEMTRRNVALWPVLVGVLTRDDETVDRVAQALAASVASGLWQVLAPDQRDTFRIHATAALSGLLPADGTEVTS